MQENLVIVESPAKAKTIEKFLGKDYIVKSSFGHIRDLSKKTWASISTTSSGPSMNPGRQEESGGRTDQAGQEQDRMAGVR